MEAWRFSRYDRPYLAVDDVYADEDAGGAVLVTDAETFDLAVDGAEPAEIVRRLKELRDPESSMWPQLVAVEDGDPWAQLASELDALGLVANADSGRGDVAESEAGALQDLVGDVVDWLRQPSPAWDGGALAGAVHAVQAVAGRGQTFGLPTVQVAGTVNMPLTALGIQRRYWAASAPLVAAAVDLLLARVLDDAGAAAVAAEAVESFAAGPEAPRDAEAAVYGTATLLALSTRPDAARICARPAGNPARISGMNLALAAERSAHHALEEIGPTRYITAMETGRRRRR
jgi:hypothetical protein